MLWGTVETSDFGRAPGSTREEWDSGESGVHGEREKAGWRIELPCGTLRGWPTAGVRAQTPGDRILSTALPHFESQGRGPGGCMGMKGVGAINMQAANPCISSWAWTVSDQRQPC